MKFRCRICFGEKYSLVINLGELALSGIFPKAGENVETTSLILVSCDECKLTQLIDSQPIEDLYTDGYGYESHLNKSMSKHLGEIVSNLTSLVNLNNGDVVLDIASNDGTLLSKYEDTQLIKVGVDPLISSLSDFYPSQTIKIESFFNSEIYEKKVNKTAKIITACSVFYDLENPKKFILDIEKVLDDFGICFFEQSYLYSMFETLSFDTICHEHLLYLRLIDFERLLHGTDLEVFDVKLNNVNGGSFQVYLKKKSNNLLTVSTNVAKTLQYESALELNSGHEKRAQEFAHKTESYPNKLHQLLDDLKNASSREIYALGASTKGNVLLQYCGLDSTDVVSIGEINQKKFGLYTPGSKIPIIAEKEILSLKKNISLLILPWHFQKGIIEKIKNLKKSNFNFIVPLPIEPKVIDI